MIYVKAILIIIEIISSILLIVIILLQRSKSEGLGLAFGSQMGESLFGARAGNVLVKATVWLGIIFIVNTTVLARIYSRGSSSPSLISESSAPAPSPVGQPVNQPPAPAVPMSAPMTPLAPTPSPVVPFSVPAATPAPAP
ncbi:MAG: preprotein translocase subunit SecG [Kiritimatiellae bacterium]|nr:preprotein translocase subunit SecG [Verrucomicrobiota bacterium]MBU4285889.1 preprotein translocase subunit SecG [Verrucomicrobiota bacterium]MBU4366387.1 preprotein translocase subunit SecG [Verrucomicrobiota bacterium]MCG2661776.1 preprotein translocase subunit SecG [Kiritimatiellia bacterium]